MIKEGFVDKVVHALKLFLGTNEIRELQHVREVSVTLFSVDFREEDFELIA